MFAALVSFKLSFHSFRLFDTTVFRIGAIKTIHQTVPVLFVLGVICLSILFFGTFVIWAYFLMERGFLNATYEFCEFFLVYLTEVGYKLRRIIFVK
jgi:hypothetical protein